jgi:hypothetical protein
MLCACIKTKWRLLEVYDLGVVWNVLFVIGFMGSLANGKIEIGVGWGAKLYFDLSGDLFRVAVLCKALSLH